MTTVRVVMLLASPPDRSRRKGHSCGGAEITHVRQRSRRPTVTDQSSCQNRGHNDHHSNFESGPLGGEILFTLTLTFWGHLLRSSQRKRVFSFTVRHAVLPFKRKTHRVAQVQYCTGGERTNDYHCHVPNETSCRLSTDK
jgi:hypothetical protein